MKILLSRTDKIGDVILTLPMAGILKSIDPSIQIFFLGSSYTADIIHCSEHVDVFIDWDKLKNNPNAIDELKKYNIDIVLHVFPNKNFAKLAKQAKIPVRIGTNRRWFHFLYCNRLVNLSRKKSFLHEAQLNILMLRALKNLEMRPIGLEKICHFYGFTKIKPLDVKHPAHKLIEANKFNLILHPKSGGSASDWPIENFIALANSLTKEKINIFFTGSEDEKKILQSLNVPHTHNVAGLMTLGELIEFINACDGLVAGSTGPLHIAAALGKKTIGLYPSKHSMHPRRWGALGAHSINFEMDEITVKDIVNQICARL